MRRGLGRDRFLLESATCGGSRWTGQAVRFLRACTARPKRRWARRRVCSSSVEAKRAIDDRWRVGGLAERSGDFFRGHIFPGGFCFPRISILLRFPPALCLTGSRCLNRWRQRLRGLPFFWNHFSSVYFFGGFSFRWATSPLALGALSQTPTPGMTEMIPTNISGWKVSIAPPDRSQPLKVAIFRPKAPCVLLLKIPKSGSMRFPKLASRGSKRPMGPPLILNNFQ